MSDVALAKASSSSPQEQPFKWWPRPSKFEKLIRHLTAIAAWCYFVIDLFVFDLDAFFQHHIPSSLSWIIPYKFFVFLALAAIILATVSTRRILAWLIYIFFYPLSRFTLLCLYAGIFLYIVKSWPLLFSVLNFILSFIQSFKQNFILLSVIIICSTAIIISNSTSTQTFCAFALMTVAFLVVLRRIISLFRPSRLFRMYTKLMAAFLNFTQKNFVPPPEVRTLVPTAMDKQQLDKWSNNLQNAIFVGALCDFLITKFSEYRKGGLPFLYYLLNFLGLLFVIVFLFSMINEGIAGADTHAFLFANGRHFFDFLYYSFSTLFLQRIPDITPISTIARLAWMIETFFAFLLGAVIISMGFALRKTLDDAGIEDVIATLRSQSASMDSFVQSEFSLSMDGAIAELERLQRSVWSIISFLRATKG